MKNRTITRLLLNWRNVVFVLIILGVFIFLKNTPLFEAILKGDLQKIKTFVGNNRISILLFSTFIMIIQNSFTIIPLLLVITINITFFGFLLGFLWSWLTSILAAILIFFLVRYLFQGWLLSKVDEKLVEKVENKGFIYVFEARIFPFIPTSLVNILAGVSSIKFSSFLLGTLFGNFIYFFVLALIPVGFLSSTVNEYILGGILLLCLIFYYVYSKKRATRKVSSKMGE
ncbi:VTT domain-containing protein [Robertmurraya korlensis]|uniref:TVP38/TMEM64 family protein n=1 Tax=Robertmurraya korlensis TaxID=519977 RepID=UPI00203C733B|nr:VTT domain-containing protein [Robertmurraya korlensis]MCM3601489.1 VTT domain-containing protein [Robertmurraya korlensis]